MTTSDAEYRERNLTVVETFRANNGRMPNGAAVLLLTSKGARSEQTRLNPLAYTRDGERFCRHCLSKGGNPSNPDWYHNVVANPEVTVEVDGDRFQARARVTEGAERERLFGGAGSTHAEFRGVPAQDFARIPRSSSSSEPEVPTAAPTLDRRPKLVAATTDNLVDELPVTPLDRAPVVGMPQSGLPDVGQLLLTEANHRLHLQYPRGFADALVNFVARHPLCRFSRVSSPCCNAVRASMSSGGRR